MTKDVKIKKEKRMNKDELAKFKEECGRNLEGWQRAKADYENLKKRSEEEKMRIAQFANADLLLQLISVVDNFQSAYAHLPKELEGDNWVEGIRFIKEQMEKFLEDNEVTIIDTKDKKFDPEMHEALESVESDKEEGVIIEEVLQGYMMKDRVIRPAKVRVSSGSNEKVVTADVADKEAADNAGEDEGINS